MKSNHIGPRDGWFDDADAFVEATYYSNHSVRAYVVKREDGAYYWIPIKRNFEMHGPFKTLEIAKMAYVFTKEDQVYAAAVA